MDSKDIENDLAKYAKDLGVSTTKLRAIFARGVDECLEEGYEGAPWTYGFARVQRFSMSLSTGNPRLTKDTDFLPRKPTQSQPTHYIVSEDTAASWSLVYDIMSADGSVLAKSFPQGSITQTIFDTDKQEITVIGTYDDVQWSCVLNLVSGKSILLTDSD